MVGDYISREAAIELFEQAFDNNWEVSGTLDRIRAIPAADVVEVVRCRECKHSVMYKFSCNYERVLVCNAPGVTIRAVKPMHFCADGKRKDGGQEDV